MKSVHKLATCVALFAAIVGMAAVSALAADKADYVFKNGAIYTLDSKNPTAQAIAITANTFPTSEPTKAFRRSSATRRRSSISKVRCCCRALSIRSPTPKMR